LQSLFSRYPYFLFDPAPEDHQELFSQKDLDALNHVEGIIVGLLAQVVDEQ